MRGFAANAAVALTAAAAVICAFAQTRDDNFGGLGNYPIPSDGGTLAEFDYCVLYAKRAWRVANMVEERSLSMTQAKAWARDGLGRTAAAEEIDDYERLEKKELPSPDALAADRFVRCAARLKLSPEPRHRSNTESCFRSLVLLDQAARMRVDGKSSDQVSATIFARRPNLDKRFVDSTVRLAFTGPSLAQESRVIEDTFAACFARAGEGQSSK